jgi:hypothetical protein
MKKLYGYIRLYFNSNEIYKKHFFMQNILFLIGLSFTFISYSQINQNDTTICSGSVINLSADSASCLNEIFNQTKNFNSGWLVGTSVTPGVTYKVTVNGTYSMFGNCQNALDAAYTYQTGTCNIPNCGPYNGGPMPIGRWYIQEFLGARPDNDVCGGNGGEYYYTLTANTTSLMFGFQDDQYGDNTGSMNMKIEEIFQDSVIWSNGSNNHTISVSPSVTTTYYCTRYLCNQVFYDSVTVYVDSPDTTNIIQTACNEFSWNGITYTQSGIYSASLNNVSGCDSIVNLDLTIITNPIPPTVYLANEVNLYTDNQANSTYQWILCSDNLIIPNETQSSLTAPFNGVFGVIVTNTCGADTSDCISVENVGIKEFESNIEVFPNPLNDVLMLSGLPEFDTYFQIFDLTGRCVCSGNINSSKNFIDLSFLLNGSYSVRLLDKGYFRIIKE